MEKLHHPNGSWSKLQQAWAEQCHVFSEDFQSYAPETMDLLGRLVEETQNSRWDGVFAMRGEGDHSEAVCFMNCTFIPSFTGRVLRIRHILLSPKNDFGNFDESEYANLLGELFERILKVSDEIFGCKHVKIHFRSPADLALFRKLKDTLLNSAHFESVSMNGAWLVLTKA